MNALPVPVAPSDPTTPGAKASPTALGAALTTAVTGTPLALVFSWLLESYATVKGQPLKLDSTTATAIGALGASVIGYASQVVHGFFTLLQERFTRPPSH